MVIETFHYVAFDEPGRRDTRAICGQRVDRYREHSVRPTCPDCKRLLADREAVSVEDAFGPSTPGTQVRSAWFDPFKGYREKTR